MTSHVRKFIYFSVIPLGIYFCRNLFSRDWKRLADTEITVNITTYILVLYCTDYSTVLVILSMYILLVLGWENVKDTGKPYRKTIPNNVEEKGILIRFQRMPIKILPRILKMWVMKGYIAFFVFFCAHCQISFTLLGYGRKLF